MLAIQAEKAGGPEVLRAVDIERPSPGPGQILVRHEAIGLNFVDTYQRSGLYPMRFPAVLGQEAAGTVEALGEGVERFAIGDRVAYLGQGGAYAEFQTVAAARAVALLP
ncbi:MAG: alcohol dehydrogenase catalytic domain-containing protein, partial [Caulobacteraceae bacterium]